MRDDKVSGLEPQQNVFRFMFVAAGKFVGECHGGNFHLATAHPNFDRSFDPTELDRRTHIVFSIRVEPIARSEGEARFIPTYGMLAEEFSGLLAAFFGKLVVNLGHCQAIGSYRIPETYKDFPRLRRMPFNSSPRRPGNVEPTLCNVKDLAECLFFGKRDDRAGCIIRAAEFYRAALENMDERIEVALTMFCSTLEALLPLGQVSDDELYDPELNEHFAKIETHCPNGDKIVRTLKARMYQIKRRLVAFVARTVPPSFFTEREATTQTQVIKDSVDLINRVRAIYDVRSKLLHTGNREGLWFLESDRDGAEIGFGSPVVEDKDLKKAITGSMTLTGLERVTWATLRAVIEAWVRDYKAEAPSDSLTIDWSI